MDANEGGFKIDGVEVLFGVRDSIDHKYCIHVYHFFHIYDLLDLYRVSVRRKPPSSTILRTHNIDAYYSRDL